MRIDAHQHFWDLEKLSYSWMPADPSPLRRTLLPADLAPFVRHVLAVFPPDRLMFGSDWPVCLQAGSWKQALAAFTQAIGAQPQAIRDKILGETAIEFYRLA